MKEYLRNAAIGYLISVCIIAILYGSGIAGWARSWGH